MKIIMLALIAFYIYFMYLIVKRIYINNKYDKMLNISTTGLRSWGRKSLYNRTESTPYLALESLIDNYDFSESDSLVDFGAGKGRVSIYLYDKCGISVTGVEINELTYVDLCDNIQSYFSSHGETQGAELTATKEYAEQYEIQAKDNKFFFFNPFDVVIFKKVINNIISDAINNNKQVDIILYYKVDKYVDFLESTRFKLHKKIKVKGSIFPSEKILVYRLKP